MFPNKIPQDFKGYPIVAAVDFMDPYVMPSLKADSYKGVEIDLIHTITNFYNFNLSFKTTPKGTNSRVVYVNRTTSGLFGLLNKHQADLAFAGMMRNPDRFATSEVIYPHTEDKLLWCYPRPKSEISWTSLYRAFSLFTWSLVLIFILLNAATITGLGITGAEGGEEVTFRSFSSTILTIWGITLDAGFPHPLKTTSLRAFAVITLFYAIIMSCSYKSCLVTFLTTPTSEKPLSSVLEALEAGYDIRMQVSAKQSQRHDDDSFWRKVLIPGRYFYNQDSDANLAYVAINRTSIYLAIFYSSEYIQSQKYLDASGKPLIHYFKETFNTFSTSLFMAPGHPLEGIFNLKNMQMVESGIVAFFLNRMMEGMKRKNMFTRIKDTTSSDDGPQPLSLKHLSIVLAGLFFALLLCFLPFIGEILLKKFTKQQRIIKEKTEAETSKLTNESVSSITVH